MILHLVSIDATKSTIGEVLSCSTDVEITIICKKHFMMDLHILI